jgi:hypothetical protein
VELKNYREVLCLVFGVDFMLISTVIVVIYIHTNNVFSTTFSPTFFVACVLGHSHSNKSEVES